LIATYDTVVFLEKTLQSNSIVGSLSFSHQTNKGGGGGGCNNDVAVQLSTLDELDGISSSNQHRWMYQDGLLKPKVQPPPLPTHWYSTNTGGDRSLGPKGGVEQLEWGQSYPLTLQSCPNDDDDNSRHMRFVMVDGRMQSLASVVVPEEISAMMTTSTTLTPPYYCMSISNGNNNDDDAVSMETSAPAGSAAAMMITLEPCDDDSSQNNNTMLQEQQQGLQSYGTVQPFIYLLQNVWGYLVIWMLSSWPLPLIMKIIIRILTKERIRHSSRL
jgi:hypothetical protein